jgi:glutamate 5-kinase
VVTKVAAARMAAWSGVPTIIAGAGVERVLARSLRGDEVGTWVEPREDRLPARKLWIAFGQASAGVLIIDDGAVGALVEKSGSLLPIGVTEVRGSFAEGAAVEVHDSQGRLVAKGRVQVDSVTLGQTMGKRGATEAIHRDDLVVLRP